MIDLMGSRFGIPIHGLWKRMAAYPSTETFVTPAGTSVTPPAGLYSRGSHCWMVDAGAPAVSITAEEAIAENAAGRTWLNYGLAYGRPDSIRMGNVTLTGPIYIDDDKTPWLLSMAAGNLRFTRFGLFNNAAPAIAQSIPLVSGMMDAFHDFTRDGRGIAFKNMVSATQPKSFTVYRLAGVPPAVTMTLEAEHLHNASVTTTFSGSPQSYQVFGLNGTGDVFTLTDTFVGDWLGTDYTHWLFQAPEYAIPRFARCIAGPVGASPVRHEAYVTPIGVMFSDTGVAKVVEARWSRDYSVAWNGSWSLASDTTSLSGSGVLTESGEYQISIGGAVVASMPWSASVSATYAPAVTTSQSANLFGATHSYSGSPTQQIPVRWTPSNINPRPGLAPAVISPAFHTYAGNGVQPWALKASSTLGGAAHVNLQGVVKTNQIAAIEVTTNTGSSPVAQWVRFGDRDGALSSTADIINNPASSGYKATMHPVTRQFEKAVGAESLVFV